MVYIRHIQRLIVCLLWLSVGQVFAFQLGGNNPLQENTATPKFEEDVLGRRTPRGTAEGFINALAANNMEKAEMYFDFSTIRSKKVQQQIVQNLKDWLDLSGNMLPYAGVSNAYIGDIDEDLPANQELIGNIRVDEDTKVGIILQVKKNKNGAPLWLISKETIDFLRGNPATAQEGTHIDDVLPDFLQTWMIAGAPAGHWFAVVLVAIVIFVGIWGMLLLLRMLLMLMMPQEKRAKAATMMKAISLPLNLFLSAWFGKMLVKSMGVSIIVRQAFSWLPMVFGIAAIGIFLWALIKIITDVTTTRMQHRGNVSGLSVVAFLGRTLKVIIVVFAAIAVFATFGIDVTTWLAALGIGGIALALGAQKTVENFVGSVTLIADQPIRSGDFCKIGDTTGTVEQIGMRSTRIRTLDRTIVTIPNGQLSSIPIENYTHREKFLFNPVIGLRYETSTNQLRYVLVALRKVLYAHPMVYNDPARVRFTNLGSHSLDVEVFAYVRVKDYDSFLEVKEDLQLLMMEVIEKSGTDFAFPSQMVYMAKDNPLSEAKTSEAEAAVADWKAQNEMPLPKFDNREIAELDGTLDYPPKGSSGYKPK